MTHQYCCTAPQSPDVLICVLNILLLFVSSMLGTESEPQSAYGLRHITAALCLLLIVRDNRAGISQNKYLCVPKYKELFNIKI